MVYLINFFAMSFLYNIILRSKSPVESLYLEETKTSSGSVFHRSSDVGLLFNQQRLMKTIGIDTVNAWLQGLSSYASNAVDSIKSKVSDEDLFKFVKSRHIQSASELLLWSAYLEENFASELQRYEQEVSTADVDVKPLNNAAENVISE